MSKIYLIDKREDWTSHDVVAKSKRLLQTKKVGHCGTLDPFATGLLVVFSNHATKVARFIESEDKTYVAKLQLGIKTTSADTEGEVVLKEKVPSLTKNKIEQALKSLIGKQSQLPPMYSALKVNGRRLYEYARENIDIERKAREIEIFELNFISYENEILEFEVKCSKGTYVRTLGEDIATKLGTIGYLISLRRTKIGSYRVEDAIDVEDISKEKGLDLADALSFMDKYIVPNDRYQDIRNGKDIIIRSDKEYVLVCSESNVALAIYEKKNRYLYHCARGLWSE